MSTKLFTIPLFSILFFLASCSSPSKSVPHKSKGDQSDDSNEIRTITTTGTENVSQEEQLEVKEGKPKENLITDEGFINLNKKTEAQEQVKSRTGGKKDRTTSRSRKKMAPGGRGSGGMAPKVNSVTSFDSVDPDKLRDFMKKNRKQINNCYKEGKTEDANSDGTLKAKLKINLEGKVSSCEIIQHLNNESVGNCVCKKIKTWNFPAKSKEYDLTYFWKFK